MTTITIDPSWLAEAKEMYMNYASVTKIAKKVQQPRTSVQYYVNKTWRAERTTLKSEIVAELSENKKSQIVEIAGLTLEVVNKFLKEMSKPDVEVSTQDARAAVVIFAELDKILRLDAGEATEIHGVTRPSTKAEIYKRLQADPFQNLQIEDIQTLEKDIEDEEHHINVNFLTNPEPSSEDDSDS